MHYQKSLIYFLTSLESNDLLMKRLQRNHLFEMYPDDLNLLEDVLTTNAQSSNMTKISSDILSQMMDAYASIISNNVNAVMKLLAFTTIILSIPTVIASVYGMNIPLPGQQSGWAFGESLGSPWSSRCSWASSSGGDIGSKNARHLVAGMPEHAPKW